MKRGEKMELLKDILLILSGGMIGVTVMCLLRVSAASNREIESQKGK
jgi:hypothetical protein